MKTIFCTPPAIEHMAIQWRKMAMDVEKQYLNSSLPDHLKRRAIQEDPIRQRFLSEAASIIEMGSQLIIISDEGETGSRRS